MASMEVSKKNHNGHVQFHLQRNGVEIQVCCSGVRRPVHAVVF